MEPKANGQSMESTKLFLFGDQTIEFGSSLNKVVAAAKQKSPLARKFLSDALDTIRLEARQTGTHKLVELESLDTLLSSPERFDEVKDETGIIHTTFSCIARLGELILHAEQDPTLLSPKAHGPPVQAVGLCTGLLPAVALAAARDVRDLANVALAMVGVAFRLRLELHRRSRAVEGGDGIWGYLVVGQTPSEVEAALDSFHQAQRLPMHKRAYIAVAARSWSAVFGPPSTMSRLFHESSVLRQASVTELYRANGCVHASHLPGLDTAYILGANSELLKRQPSPAVSIMSTSKCRPFQARTLKDLLGQVLDDIATLRLDMDGTMDAAAESVPTGSDLQVLLIGGANAVSALKNSLGSRDLTLTVVEGAVPRPQPALRNGSGRVAIVGVSGRFPDAESVDEFWQNLLAGRESHKLVPESRFGLDAWKHALGPDATLPYGCFLNRPGQFDAKLFNISPREAEQMEPMHRLQMLTTYEALEDAGYAPNATSSTDKTRISAFIAQSSDDWRDINHQHGIETHYVPSIARAFGAGCLHHYFKWEGPAFTVDAACGSSAVAIALACSSLVRGDCDTAVVGGSMLACSPDAMAGLAKGGFLSPTGSCKTFRDDVDGYCRGEAVGSVVLKRLEDAELDGDRILGVVDGWARNHSAYASSITHPHQPSQERVFHQAMRMADAAPEDVGYVEAHGTGTVAGDVCEVKAIANVIGGSRAPDNQLVLGAVKANVGHAEAGAAIVALIKVAMIFKNKGVIPPQPGFDNPVNPVRLNPEFPHLAARHIHIANGRQHLAAGKKAILNCFDATGGNTCLVLSPPPSKLALPKSMGPGKHVKDPRTHHVVVCSGHTFNVMKRNERRILDYLISHKDASVADLAYTTSARRVKQHDVRAAWTVADTKELGRLLLKETSRTEHSAKRPGTVVFTFTGQGAAYRGMASQLFETSPQFRSGIMAAQRLCDLYGFPSVVEYIQGQEQHRGAAAAAAAPEVVAAQEQLSLVALQTALVDLLRFWGLRPDVVMGHSLGEYAGLCAAGVLSLGDTLYLVGRRAGLLGQHCRAGDYGMLVLPVGSGEADKMIASSRGCCIACKNTPSATVVSGPLKEIHDLQAAVRKERGIETTILPVQYGFHSSQMESIAEDLERLAEEVHFSSPQIPVASTLLGRIIKDGGTLGPKYLSRQTREAVDFVATVEAISAGGLADKDTIWVEIGPDAVNTSMVRKTLGIKDSDRLVPALKKGREVWATLSELVASAYCRGHHVDWHNYHRHYEPGLELLDMPSYSFDLVDYWRPYVHPTSTAVAVRNAKPLAPPPVVLEMTYLTSYLQYVKDEQVAADGTITAHFVSRVDHPEMVAAAQNHLVNGVPIFPGSAFCEMALAAAKYLIPKHRNLVQPPDISSMVIQGLEMNRPLIISTASDASLLLTRAVCHGRGVRVEFSVRDGHDTLPLGAVGIAYEKGAALKTKAAPMFLFFVRNRLDGLVKAVAQGEGHLLRTSLIYQLFQRYVHYGKGFQGIQQCWLSQDGREAACTIRLPSSPSATGERDAFNMYWRDCVFHLAGYMLNGHPDGPTEEANIAVAVGEIVFEEELTDADTYQAYTRIEPTEEGYVGDVFVFRGEKLVGICSDVVYKTVQVRGAGQKQVTAAPLVKDHQEMALASLPDLGRNDHSAHSTSIPAQPREAAMDRTICPGYGSMTSAPVQSKAPSKPQVDVAEMLLDLISEETGWDKEEFDSVTNLADLGVDSLMNIVLASKMKSDKGIQISAAKFRTCLTVADIRREFGTTTTEEPSAARTPSPDQFEQERAESPCLSTPNDSSDAESGYDMFSSATEGSDSGMMVEIDPPNQQHKSSPTTTTIVTTTTTTKLQDEFVVEDFLIQGEEQDGVPPLFLFPDGSGSVTSFVQLPNLASNIAVYGLHSPWVKEPERFDCTIEEATALYLAAIRARQPRGPYLLGGWSAGCVLAYECARLLGEAGDEVLGLVFIDMHCPRPLPQWIDTTRELWEYWCETTGLDKVFAPLPGGADLGAHLISNFRALNRYHPKPMTKTPRHGTLIIWAKKGMGNGLRKEDFPDMSDPLGVGEWFCFDRTEFGPNGWEKLVGDKVECVAVDGHHRSIMVPPDAYQMINVIDKALERFLS
ncbi:Type I Iterative PKS [Pyricularia oryzae]|nr:Type I Iterative PKS [Pyricularia oryzae]